MVTERGVMRTAEDFLPLPVRTVSWSSGITLGSRRTLLSLAAVSQMSLHSEQQGITLSRSMAKSKRGRLLFRCSASALWTTPEFRRGTFHRLRRWLTPSSTGALPVPFLLLVSRKKYRLEVTSLGRFFALRPRTKDSPGLMWAW